MRNHGFTLVELVIVIMILGVLAGVAAPRLLNVSREAEITSVQAEVEAIVKSVELYAAFNGSLPPDADAGDCPTGMDRFIDPRVFADPSPIGGAWDWSQDGSGGDPILAIVNPNTTLALIKELDDSLDDGETTTGYIQLSGRRIQFLLDP